MKTSIRKYIKYISLKNMILPVIVLVIVVAALFLIPFKDIFQPDEASSAKECLEMYEEGERYVKVSISELTYTGYDYYKNGVAEASFYYSETEDGCVFFLVSEEDKQESFRARMVRRNEYVNTFLANFARDLSISEAGLEKISGGFIVSGVDYRLWMYIALFALVVAAALAAFLFMLANIIIFFNPSAHPACRRLKKYGLSGKDFSDIDRELKEEIIVEAGNMFATSHYLVVFGRSTLCMVPLFNIVWAYKYLSRQLFVSRRLLSYTLVIYTSPGGKIVMRGNRKKYTDTILAFLGRDFSHITVGYTEEQHNKMKAMAARGEI